jgi:hypothetical protein
MAKQVANAQAFIVRSAALPFTSLDTPDRAQTLTLSTPNGLRGSGLWCV